MGTYTPDKDLFDQLTKDYFIARGYAAEIISGAGFSDVVGWHDRKRELAIVEVKSPSEKDAQTSFTTSHNASNMSREQVLALIKPTAVFKQNPGLCRLYAYTISSQLYTYYRKVDGHAKAFLKKQLGTDMNTIKTISAWLAVPSEKSGVLEEVLKILRGSTIIRGSKSEVCGEIVICRIDY